MNLSDCTFLVVDVETTGLDPATEQVVEFAAVKLAPEGLGFGMSELFRPTVPISAEASAVNGLTQEFLETNGLPQTHIPGVLASVIQRARPAVIVAHNARFDRSFLPDTGCQWLCTRNLARLVFPGLASYKLQELRQTLCLRPRQDGPAHRALADAYLCAALLQALLARIGTVSGVLHWLTEDSTRRELARKGVA